MSTVDFSRVNELAKKYEPEMTRFLRDMIRIPSESDSRTHRFLH